MFLTLDEPMVRKLYFKSLRRRVGGMDYIYGLLITEDDLEDGHESDWTSNMAASSIATDYTLTAANSPEPSPTSGGNSTPPWCKCSIWFHASTLRTSAVGIDVWQHSRFQKHLNADVLQLIICNKLRHEEDNSTRLSRNWLVTGSMSLTIMGTWGREKGSYAFHVWWKLFTSIILPRSACTWDLGKIMLWTVLISF